MDSVKMPKLRVIIRLWALLSMLVNVQGGKGSDWQQANVLEGADFNPAVCQSILETNGCYTAWQTYFCSDKGTYARSVLNGTVKVPTQQPSDAEVYLFPTQKATFDFIAKADGSTISSLLYASNSSSPQGMTPWQVATMLTLRVAGVWMVDDLVQAGAVQTILGQALNDTECCYKRFERRADGKVVVYFGNSTQASEIVAEDSLCNGVRLLYIDMLPEVIPDGIEDSPGFESLRGWNYKNLPVYNGMTRGWCNVTAGGLFSAVADLVDQGPHLRTYLEQFEPSTTYGVGERDSGTPFQDDVLFGESVDIAVTWFVAQRSLVEGSKDQEAGSMVYDDSQYLLYHMLAGTYCPDELLAAGSVNTALGVATGQYLPLAFEEGEQGQIIVTAPSAGVDSEGTPRRSTVNKTLEVVGQYSNCRSVIYILSDDFHTPPESKQLVAPAPEDTWQFLHNATRDYHQPVWEAGCFNPLPPTTHAWSGSSSDVNLAQEGGGEGGLSGGAIAGIVLGSVALLMLTVSALYVIVRRRRVLGLPNAAQCAPRIARFSSYEVQSTQGSSDFLCSSMVESSGQSYLLSVPKDWVINDIQLLKKVGSGSFGAVFVGKWQNCHVAVKRFGNDGEQEDVGNDWDAQTAVMQKEVSVMSSLRHPNVVQFLGIMRHPPSLVMEYCQKGSLHGVLQKAAADNTFLRIMGWKRRIKMAIDAANGMEFLHGRKDPIIHRDLKSPNLLVTKTWAIKVSDFGTSKIVDPASAQTSITAFNPRWLAPELHGPNGRTTTASDVYSFGIVMWELLTLQEPFKGLATPQIIFGVVECSLRPVIPSVDTLPGDGSYVGAAEYIALMQRCWAQQPHDRPTFKQVVQELRAILQLFAEPQTGCESSK